jgi:hypothetical protein
MSETGADIRSSYESLDAALRKEREGVRQCKRAIERAAAYIMSGRGSFPQTLAVVPLDDPPTTIADSDDPLGPMRVMHITAMDLCWYIVESAGEMTDR